MKKFIYFLCLITLGMFCGSIIYSLSNKHHTVSNDYNLSQDKDIKEPSVNTSINKNTLNIQENKHTNPFTGEIMTSEKEISNPFFCIIENSVNARPQSGLSEADIVYETLAEGGIPRFLALFYNNSPEKIGPVRSIRPYFIDITTEYNLPFAHCGGSAEALTTISSNNTLQSINEIAQPKPFWRDASRKAPHNLYTSAKNIKDFISENNLTTSTKINFKFNDSYWISEELNGVSLINLNPSKTYSTSYKYINGKYTKYMDGKLALDTNTNEALTFKNIIVQKTKISLQSDENHINVDLIGSGDGYLFSNGKVEKINWSKDTKSSPTLIQNSLGNTIPLSVGNTIWHVIDTNSKISFE